ncbi:MAG: hypothetical protein JSV05_07010 [Candidatus Bathyarchaeota archaeon]|nr:MAG: hypothetical protein JSV05_07010 [Candidatus Bathyarchaeota archaeon]
MKYVIRKVALVFIFSIVLGVAFYAQEYKALSELFSMSATSETAQPPLTAWTNAYGGSEWDQAYSVVQIDDGKYVFVGRTNSFGAGNLDCLLIKTDTRGNTIWSKTFGGTDDDWPSAVIQTDDGGYVIAGGTRSTGAGSYDFWVLKTGSQGNVIWDKTYGEAAWDFAHSVVQTVDGGYAITGVKDFMGANSGDFWLVKIDASGNVQWNQTYGDVAPDEALALVQTSDGGYAMAGTGFANLVKTNADGDQQWAKYYGFVANSLDQTNDTGYILTGYSYDTNAEDYDLWLIKTDADGNIQWNKTIGGSGWDFARSVIQTSDGGYAIAGYTRSYGAGSYDFWLIKADIAGNLQWNQTYGGTYVDQAFSVIETSDRGYLMIGKTDSFGSGSSDFWLVKLAGPWNYDVTGDGYCGIDDIVAVAEHFSTYPGHQNWNPIYDINEDSYVGIDDIVLIAEHFGESII